MNRRYWDSCTFLAWLQNEPDTAAACYDTLKEAENGEFVIVTSALTLTETLWMRGGPRLGREKAHLLNRFFRRSFLRVVNLNRAIAEDAQSLVWDYDVRPKDAIHVATARQYQCSLMETFDRGLLSKDGEIENLAIREPRPARQPSLPFHPPSP